MLSDPKLDAGSVRDLSVAALLRRLMADREGDDQAKVGLLLEAAKDLGLDQLRVSSKTGD